MLIRYEYIEAQLTLKMCLTNSWMIFLTLLYCRQTDIWSAGYFTRQILQNKQVFIFFHNIFTSKEVYFVFAGHLTCVFGELLFSFSGS